MSNSTNKEIPPREQTSIIPVMSKNHNARDSRKRIVEKAYDSLKTKILRNELPPGYQALEQDIADMLFISRTPVREVLARLQDEGLVERIPRHGVKILSLSPNDVRELYELLQCLEGKAVELLAMRRLPADSVEVSKLLKDNAEVENHIRSGDIEAWSEADWEFHKSIFESCGNKRLARMAIQTWEQVHRVDITTMDEKPYPQHSPIDHQDILNAIIQHDVIMARELIFGHRTRGMNISLEALNQRRITSRTKH